MKTRPIRKIAFIEPKSPGSHVYSKWGLPRLGTIQLGTILKEAGYEISVYLEEIGGIDFEEVFECDAVGISTITSTAPRAYEMANQIRKAGIPVFMGGPHVSFLVREALEHCDYVLRGETEETIIPFIKALESGSGMEGVRGLSRMDGELLLENEMPAQCLDLDRFPFPDFKLIKGSKRKNSDTTITPIMTSRGCPFGCNFCSVTRMFGRNYRYRSTDNVIAELKEKQHEWIFFYDDNFAAHKQHTKELLTKMIELGITPKWSAQVRIDIAKDDELMDLMVKAGCTCVYIGLESINPKTLLALNKGQTPEDMASAIDAIHKHGINIHGMFIFGSDNDDLKTIRQTVKFAKRTGLTSVQFMILVPLPGTPVFQQMEAEGRLLSRDWGYYDAHHVVFQPKNMSYLDLQKYTIKAMIKFYSLRQIFNRLNQFDIWAMVVRAYGWRMTRQMRRNSREFVANLKEQYRNAGKGLASAKHEIEFKARRTSDDLKAVFQAINWEKIKKIKDERLAEWRKKKLHAH